MALFIADSKPRSSANLKQSFVKKSRVTNPEAAIVWNSGVLAQVRSES